MFKVSCSKEFLSLSNFSLILFIVSLLIITDKSSCDKLTYTSCLIYSMFILSVLSVIFLFRQLKTRNEKNFNDSSYISNATLNMKGVEVWFVTMSPILVLSPDSEIEKLLILCVILILLRIISAQDIFVFNILFCIVGYNFWEITIDDRKYVCITALNKSQLVQHVGGFKKYSIVSDGVIYIKR